MIKFSFWRFIWLKYWIKFLYSIYVLGDINFGVKNLEDVDDMMIIRGVNIYPSAIEQILREFPEIREYRITATKEGAMDALQI